MSKNGQETDGGLREDEDPWEHVRWGLIFSFMTTEELQRYLDWVVSSLASGTIGVHEAKEIRKWMVRNGRGRETSDPVKVTWYAMKMKQSILRWYSRNVDQDDIIPPDQTV